MKEIDFERYLENEFSKLNNTDFYNWFYGLSVDEVCKYANKFAAEVHDGLS